MNDLQLSLLAIGGVIVAGVVLFNWYQERSFRRPSEKAFSRDHDDVLLRVPTRTSESDERVEPTLVDAQEGQELEVSPTNVETNHPSIDSQWCDPAIDYIVELKYAEPINASAIGELLCDTKEVGKPVSCIGFDVNSGRWEEVSAIPTASFSALKIAIQLANRNGPINHVQLIAFCDMVKDIGLQTHAEINFPDSNRALASAVELDQFCSDVDVSIVFNIICRSGASFAATKIQTVAQSLGLRLESDGVFYFYGEGERTLFTLSNRETTKFIEENMQSISTQGVTLTFEVPTTSSRMHAFEEFAQIAKTLTTSLGGLLVDDNYVPLNEQGVEKIKLQLVKIYNEMDHHQTFPGSARAARLFS